LIKIAHERAHAWVFTDIFMGQNPNLHIWFQRDIRNPNQGNNTMTNFKMVLAMDVTTLWAGAATAQQIGVVGLYQNGASLNAVAATDLGCVDRL